MKVFALEDNEVRIVLFRKWIPTIHITKDVKVAIELLKKNSYSLIFLDHDLGGVFEVSGPNTGYEIAKYIADNDIKGKIIIHSYNTVGAKNMMALLPKAIYLPFGSFICVSTIENGELVNLEVKPSKLESIGD